MPDLQFYNAGSFAMCTPLTDAGKQWCMENIDSGEDTMWPIAIEFRYLPDIVLGARADGLVCEG